VRTITVPAEIAATQLRSSLTAAIAPTAIVQLITFLVQTGPVAACRVPAPLEPPSRVLICRVLICRVPIGMLICREPLLRVRTAVLDSIVRAVTAERIIFQGQICLARAAAKTTLSISTPPVLAVTVLAQMPIGPMPAVLVPIDATTSRQERPLGSALEPICKGAIRQALIELARTVLV